MVEASVRSSIAWQDAYALGVAQIDREHQHLFALAAKMHEGLLAGKGKDQIEKMLTELVNYTCHHFAHEEKLMQKTGYPGYEQHRQDHANLRAEVLAKQLRARSGEATMTIEVMQFLIEWIPPGS